jgi:hypothetical protein
MPAVIERHPPLVEARAREIENAGSIARTRPICLTRAMRVRMMGTGAFSASIHVQ